MKYVFFLIFAAVLASSEVVRAAALPNLPPSSVYTGSATLGTTTCTFVLRLQRGQGFVLRETVQRETAQHEIKTTEQIRTGKWHQIENNTLVQLSNQSGFYSLMNVGATGNLYFDCPLPEARYVPLTLRPESPSEATVFAYPVSGLLRFAKDGASLEDKESSLLHRVQGDALDALRSTYKDRPAFVEVEVEETDELARGIGESPELRVHKVLQATEDLPRPTQGTLALFRDVVAGSVWEALQTPGTKPFRFTFITEKGKTTGTLTFSDSLQTVEIPYTLSEQGLRFAESGLKALRKAGHEQTADKLAQVRAWRVEGRVLELRNKTHVVDILEKRNSQ